MPSLLHSCLTKATDAEGDQIQRGPNWLLSRRGILRVFDDHLECGNWHVDYREIQDAVLFSVRSMLIPGFVLRISTGTKTYHFGLNWGRFWQGHLPFAARREMGRLRYSAFSLATRFLLVAAIAYYVWRWAS